MSDLILVFNKIGLYEKQNTHINGNIKMNYVFQGMSYAPINNLGH